ncbi:MAG: ATP-dependent 6-phosphofructokinase [Firmicutes bacterium]|nr:ATP-dependent 6-phosphofructokinase [Bacillota bacterium]
MAKKIAVLTSGGDAPGMNTCVKAIVETGLQLGIEVYGVFRGYQGLMEGDVRLLTVQDVKYLGNFGGSFLQSARSEAFRTPEGKAKAAAVVKKLKLAGLICIGGNGTLKGAGELSELGVNIVAIPATIDNDVYSSERSIGFDTAVNSAVNMIDNIKQTMSSNGRVAVIEVMGRHGGDIALFSALASDSNIVVVPEEPVPAADIIKRTVKLVKQGVSSPTIIVAEKQHDIKVLADEIEAATKKECRAIILGYMQRGGSPTSNDRILSIRYGVQAVHLLNNGSSTCSLAVKNDLLTTVDINEAVAEKSHFRSDMYALFRLLHDPK